jgi:hypothetical protein
MSQLRKPVRGLGRVGLGAGLGWSLALGLTLGLAACDPSDDAATTGSRRVPDATLRAHVVAPSTPTAEGLAYLRAMAHVHERADGTEGEPRVQALREGLSLPVPAGLAEAEVVRLDLAARLGETLMEPAGSAGAGSAGAGSAGALAARDLLAPMLAVERSLPLDRATARALVVLGDAAVKTGDDALAAGSYARSIEIMSSLRQELEP